MKICIVSHYEFPIIGGIGGSEIMALERATGKFIEIGEKINSDNNRYFKSTFCAGFHHDENDSVLTKAPHLLQYLKERGDEIGVHTHVDYHNLDDHVNHIDGDRKALLEAGFDVHCWAPGDWYNSGERTIRALEKAGYSYDLSVFPLLEPFSHSDGRFEIDYTRCKEKEPYNPDYKDICRPGNSKIIEVPVLGCFDEYKTGFEDLKTNIPLIDRIKKCDGVFQIFWHPYEFLDKNGRYDNEYIEKIYRFFEEANKLPGIGFETIHGAVSKLSTTKRLNRNI